jgi:exodeoxyribonuclease-1
MADVIATIEMAKLVKMHQPRLYDWLYQLRKKNRVIPLLDLKTRDMLLHVSGMFPASRGCLAVIMPLLMDPTNSNGIVVLDLAQDPAVWLDLEAEEIRHRLFTRSEDLGAVERVPLKTIHVNKCPSIAPMSVLSDDTRKRFSIDLDACQRHREKILSHPSILTKLAHVFTEPDFEATSDPDLMLYSGGFFNDQDRKMMNEVRLASSDKLTALDLPFHDVRLPEMLFRYRARNFPETLNGEETARWQGWCAEQLIKGAGMHGLSASAFFVCLNELVKEMPDNKALFDSLENYATGLCKQLGVKV